MRLIVCILAAMSAHAQTTPPAIELAVSSGVVPGDGLVQVQVFLREPQALSFYGVTLEIDTGEPPLDREYGEYEHCPLVEQAAAFSATGDLRAIIVRRSGYPYGCSLSAWLSSSLGGIGRLPGSPVLVFSIAPGKGFTIENQRQRGERVTIAPAAEPAPGMVAVDRVRPSGETGVLSAGAVVEIEGRGFDQETTAAIAGVQLSTVEVVSSKLIRVTSDAPMELTGRQVRVFRPDGPQARHWITPQIPQFARSQIFYTFPLSPSSWGHCRPNESEHPGYSQPNHLVIQNPNPKLARVQIHRAYSSDSREGKTVALDIPAGEARIVSQLDPPDSEYETDEDTPVRSLCFARAKAAAAWGMFGFFSWWPVATDAASAIRWVGSAASLQQDAIAPGEIISLFGDFGTGAPESGADARLLFDGDPGVVLYASDSQINGVVPYSVGEALTEIQVQTRDDASAVWGAPVRATSPALFTITGNGLGQAAALNYDSSLNSSANPAPRGSAIQLFATGQGRTVPAGAAGNVAGDDPIRPVSPVRVLIGGVGATVTYAGSSSGSITGLLQVNAVIPLAARGGDRIPVTLEIDGRTSPSGVTIALQ